MKANYANALSHRNATPLSVAVLAPCVWGENLARGGAWQGVVNSAKHNTTAWQNSMARQSKHNEFSVASVFGQNNARRHDKFGLTSVAKWAVFAGEVGKVKMRQCLGGGLLSLSLLALFGTPLG